MSVSRYRPIYKVTITNPGGKTYEFNSWYFKVGTTKKKQNNKLAIYIDRDLGKKLDVCLISMSLKSGDLLETATAATNLKVGEIKVGAEIKVYLGYAAGDEENIDLKDPADLAFAGIVDEVAQSFKKISITAFSMAYKIIVKKPKASNFNGDWETQKKSSKDIITELVKGTGLDIDSRNFSAGLSFKAYKPDEDKSIYDNIKELSDYNGFNFYISKKGEARFHDVSNVTCRVEYGKHILDYSITTVKPPFDSVEVVLNYKDANKAATITYDPITGNTTTSGGTAQRKNGKKISFGMDADQATADKVAKNILKNIYVPETGEVKIIGNTEFDLADKLMVSFGLPGPGRAAGADELSFMERNGVIITKITHKFGRKSGFITTIGWKKAPKVN